MIIVLKLLVYTLVPNIGPNRFLLRSGYEHQSSVVRTWPPLEHENDMFHDQQICLKLNLEPVFEEPSDLKG